jgi:hypothetical protein
MVKGWGPPGTSAFRYEARPGGASQACRRPWNTTFVCLGGVFGVCPDGDGGGEQIPHRNSGQSEQFGWFA